MVEERSYTNKYEYRDYIAAAVLLTVESQTALNACITRGCPRPRDTYASFVDLFRTLFVATALSVNNADIVKKIEIALNDTTEIRFVPEYHSRSLLLLNLFTGYLIQLKEDGMYNPEITRNKGEVVDGFKHSI